MPDSFPELDTMLLVDLRFINEICARVDAFVTQHAHQHRIHEVVTSLRAHVERIEREKREEVQRLAQRQQIGDE